MRTKTRQTSRARTEPIAAAICNLSFVFVSTAGTAQTFTVDRNGELVEQDPLVSGNQTTVFIDDAGRPIEDRSEPEDEEEIVLASLQRQLAQYSAHHTQVIQNIKMLARRYQRDPALLHVELTPRHWAPSRQRSTPLTNGTRRTWATAARSIFTTRNNRVFFGAALAAFLSIGPAVAQTDWGGIGDGWTSLNPKKAAEQASLEPAKVSSEGQVLPAALTLSTNGNADNRALTRTIASRYAAHPDVRRAGIDPREFVIFFEEMILTESNYNDRALSSAGAIGLAQLMPGTAKLLGVDPHNRMANLDGGARYLIAQINEFKTLSLAVAAYNAGPGAVRSYGGVPPFRETERHVAKVMVNYERRWRLISSKE